ncbi:MAG: hypothetical protein IT364_01590 [Candidatus Hydrogenedentes bacterium]|nr:hypothetical protein [Candidatus Hydrogenedentota bacterium]
MREKRQKAECGPDVLDAIRSAYPDNIVTDDVVFDEDSYYDGIRDEVRAALSRIGEADLVYDRPPEGIPHWEDGADPDEDPPTWVEDPSSYDLLFLALRGKPFEFEGEMEEEDVLEEGDEPVMALVPTVGHIGCAVGISIVAPFAVIRFTEMEVTESGWNTLPDIWPRMFNLDGSELDVEAHYEVLFLEEGINALRDLRERTAKVLQEFGIRVLSEQELGVPVPRLKPEPERNAMLQRKFATVGDALFFQTA